MKYNLNLISIGCLLVLFSCTSSGVTTTKGKSQSNSITISRARYLDNLLVQDCGSCHGLQRKGGLGPSLLAKDLEHKTEAMLVTFILEGVNGTAMPPWKHLISKEDANYLAKQLKKGI